MRGKGKDFDKKLFDENDKIARKICKEFIKKVHDLDVEDNNDIYGPDLVVIPKDAITDFVEVLGYVECEIKHSWKEKVFPFYTIQFPERKEKFATLTKPTLFCMLNSTKEYLLTVWSDDILMSPVTEVSNKYMNNHEYFYQVPVGKANFYNVKDFCDV